MQQGPRKKKGGGKATNNNPPNSIFFIILLSADFSTLVHWVCMTLKRYEKPITTEASNSGVPRTKMSTLRAVPPLADWSFNYIPYC